MHFHSSVLGRSKKDVDLYTTMPVYMPQTPAQRPRFYPLAGRNTSDKTTELAREGALAGTDGGTADATRPGASPAGML